MPIFKMLILNVSLLCMKIKTKMDKDSLRKILPALKVLQRIGPEERQTLIPFLPTNVTNGIYECIYNATCNSELPMRLRKYIKKNTIADAEQYKYLLKPNKSVRKRQKRLIQIGGGGLGHILNAVVPVLSHIVRKNKDNEEHEEGGKESDSDIDEEREDSENSEDFEEDSDEEDEGEDSDSEDTEHDEGDAEEVS